MRPLHYTKDYQKEHIGDVATDIFDNWYDGLDSLLVWVSCDKIIKICKNFYRNNKSHEFLYNRVLPLHTAWIYWVFDGIVTSKLEGADYALALDDLLSHSVGILQIFKNENHRSLDSLSAVIGNMKIQKAIFW